MRFQMATLSTMKLSRHLSRTLTPKLKLQDKLLLMLKLLLINGEKDLLQALLLLFK